MLTEGLIYREQEIKHIWRRLEAVTISFQALISEIFSSYAPKSEVSKIAGKLKRVSDELERVRKELEETAWIKDKKKFIEFLAKYAEELEKKSKEGREERLGYIS